MHACLFLVYVHGFFCFVYSLNVLVFFTVNPRQVCLKWAKNHPRLRPPQHITVTLTRCARSRSAAQPPHRWPRSVPPPPHKLSTNPLPPPDDWQSAYLPLKSSSMVVCPCLTPHVINVTCWSPWYDTAPILVWTTVVVLRQTGRNDGFSCRRRKNSSSLDPIILVFKYGVFEMFLLKELKRHPLLKKYRSFSLSQQHLAPC